MNRNARYTPLSVDGPVPAEMIRAVPAIRRDPLAFLQRMVDQHGDLVAFPLPTTPVLLVNDPAGARRVLVDGARGYGKQTIQYTSLAAVTGAGLLTSDGPPWRAHRRLAQPAFHHGALSGVADQSVAVADALAQRWSTLPDGAVVDVDAATMQATLEVVGRVLFASDLAQAGERVVAAVHDALGEVVSRARTPVPSFIPSPGRARMRRANLVLDAACADVVARRRDVGVEDSDTDLLALLLRAAGEDRLDERQVRDELVTAVIAGHETVASSLTWTLHLLAAHPGVQDTVHAELDGVLGGVSDGRAPRWEDLRGLPVLRSVVDESLRLFPPAWVVTRQALADDEIAGTPVPAGTLVILSPWLLHRRATEWPDPARFDPTRFIAGPGQDPAGEAHRRGSYLPFGAGPRLCIGRDLALVESVLALAALLRGHRVRPAPGHTARVDALVTLRPRAGMPLQLWRR